MNPSAVLSHQQRERTHFWHQARRQIIGNMIQEITECQSSIAPSTLLDVGCGSGTNLEHFKTMCSSTGIEPNELLAQQARVNSQVPISIGSLPSSMPALNSKFDIITLLDVLEHIDQDVASLKTLAKLLKPNGKLIINVPALPILWSVHDELYEHYRRYTTKSLTRTIHNAGLEIVSIRYWSSIAVPAAFVKRNILNKRTAVKNYRPKNPSRFISNLARQALTYEYNYTVRWRIPFGTSLLAVCRTKHELDDAK